jgi:MscS family membrane protein
MSAKHAGCRAIFMGLVVLVSLLFGFSDVAHTAAPNPLQPVDTSSPRASLQGFIEAVDEIYLGMKDVLEEYSRSDRLYLSAEEQRKHLAILGNASKIIRFLDLSQIPPVLNDTVPAQRALQFKEILDRIDLPPLQDIPDREAMVRASSKRWRLPGTEIDFVLIETGPRAGEFLVSAETVDRLPEFYQRIKSLPYKPGPARELDDAYLTLTSGKAQTIYEAYLSSPVGLSYIVPTRWMLNLPDWARVRVAGAAAWQWLGLGIGLLPGALVIFGGYRLANRLTDRSEDQSGARWDLLPVPLAVMLVLGFLIPLVLALLRIGETPRVVIAFTQTSVLYLTVAWLCIIGSIIVGDVIVSSEHLQSRSLDSQLIRLGTRLVGVAGAIAFLVRGADELGFPAYSVLAGLGVGGLAVALAARDSIANLLGSLLIMLEKPFRVGHYIRLSGTEGAVEDVGFRSTRIRTPDNSLISIPNNAVVNTTVENLSLRAMRRQRFFVQITYDTPRHRVEEMVAGIRRLIADHPLTNKSNFQVRFNNFGESSLDILVMFYFDVDNYGIELREREAMLLQIIDLAKDVGVEFAFPTRTLLVETSGPAAKAANADMVRWSAS